MSEHFLQSLEAIKADIFSAEQQLNDKKRLANELAKFAKVPEPYALTEIEHAVVPLGKGDEYFGKPAVTAIREVLQYRRLQNLGPATLAEIYDALLAGGYEFDAASETNAKNSLRVTLTKRSETFARLPNGKFGLVSWYGPKRKAKAKTGSQASSEVEDDEVGSSVMDAEFRKETDADRPIRQISIEDII